jgi:hypothetical protein
MQVQFLKLMRSQGSQGGIVAPKTPVKKQAVAKKQAVLVAGHPRRSVDSVAEFIGSSLGELMNRKDALAKQLASVEKQIAAARDKVVVASRETATAARKAVTPAAGKPAAATPAAAQPATKERKGNGKQKRPLPPDDPMVAQTTRAAMAQARARTAQQMRTTRRSGNR